MNNTTAFQKGILLFALLWIAAAISGCSTPKKKAYVPPFPPGVVPGEVVKITQAGPSDAQVPEKGLKYRGGPTPPVEPPPVSPGPASVSVSVSGSSLSPASHANFTVSVWFKYDEAPASSYSAIICKFDALNHSSSEWMLGVRVSGHLTVQSIGVGMPPELMSSSPATPGDWHHAVCEWKSTGEVTLYMDGTFQGSSTLAVSSPGNLPMTIGDTYPSTGARALIGKVDEIKIMRVPLTAALATALYAAVPDQDGDGIMDGDDPDDNNDGIPDEWAWQHFGDTTAGDPVADDDDDDMSNMEEFIAGTNPNDESSQFIVGPISRVPGGNEVSVSCEGLAGREYQLWSRSVLGEANNWEEEGGPVLCNTSGPLSLIATAEAGVVSFYCVTVALAGGE